MQNVRFCFRKKYETLEMARHQLFKLSYETWHFNRVTGDETNASRLLADGNNGS
jgi:hypothetical protein